MEAAWEPTSQPRGPARLMEVCAALERLDQPRLPARDRLQRVIGCELTGLLLRALAGNHRRRSGELAA